MDVEQIQYDVINCLINAHYYKQVKYPYNNEKLKFRDQMKYFKHIDLVHVITQASKIIISCMHIKFILIHHK